MQYNKDIWENGVVLSFDLVISELRQYYSRSSPQNAYNEIKKYLLDNGFTHSKDSDYFCSSVNLLQAHKLLYNFSKNHKWFPMCVRKVHLSPNVESLDITQSIKGYQDREWLAQVKSRNKNLNKNDMVR